MQFCPLPTKDTVFVHDVADSQHKGVIDSNGNPVPTPRNIYVDDNFIADIRLQMKQAMSASIEALFILMGYHEPHRRRNVVCMEKYLAAQCAYEKKQLGVRLNTRALALGLMADKKWI